MKNKLKGLVAVGEKEMTAGIVPGLEKQQVK